tara:strand:+ start:9081 stop:10166 length:1086 start_codon:yes stop_codon:yes gene_type:complete
MRQTTVKFDKNFPSDFSKVLKKRVNDYFNKNNIDRFGNFNMFFKSFVMLSMFFGPFYLIASSMVLNTWFVIGLWCLMGVGMAGIGLSIMHDGNHGAFSRNKIVNRAMGLTLNLVGGSAKLWKLQHNVLHHTFTNVEGLDEDIDGPGFLRFSPHSEHKPIHKYQHVFFIFAYGLMTFGWVMWKDYLQIFRFRKKGLVKEREFKKELLIIIFWKLFYFSYILVVPIFILKLPVLTTLIGWFLMHYVCSIILSLIFQLAHVMPEIDFPEPNENEIIENNWEIHQLQTTANFSQKSRLFSWYIGGLNYQIEHHLFSGICHVHYRKISKIVKETAKEYNIPYYTNGSFFKAIGMHYRILKKFGQAA